MCITKSESINNRNNDGMNAYFNASQIAGRTHANSSVTNDVSQRGKTVESNVAQLSVGTNTPLSEMTDTDLIKMINTTMVYSLKLFENKMEQSTDKKIELFGKDVKGEINKLENRVRILETDNEKKTEENVIMRNIICNMQKNLNQHDSSERRLNIIISGESEGIIEIDHADNNGDATSSTTLTTELEKVTWLLRYLKCEHFTEQMIAGFDLKRLGRKRDSFNRVLKVRLTSIEDRDAFLVTTPILKNAPKSLGKVFIKKDQHPVYLEENKRLRKKMYDLKKAEENQGKEIKFMVGKMSIDGVTVDKNSFFA